MWIIFIGVSYKPYFVLRLSNSPEAEDELLEGPVGEEDAEAVLVEVVAREDLEEVLGHAVQG